ncbi:uncharacterized protein B0P05DRAFT_526524 [Gilbertella persicaria]|uniref:Secreted protein n=1 Tax=Rhizopus stolonifer TaxID=4846 RepID=A0A367JYB0_RHIST|nr:uncharacterized protein B0P05DRAFT_526524 [Gilbertella persicaria]KAI8091198.1 hypothetical protein B0P05DRAFT_526524 [Gilbertella persicaria]RCH94944.1 hypothetical protein CU098_011090 [Rhizopus stolonifer]
MKSILFILALLTIITQALPVLEKRATYAVQVNSGTSFCSFLPPHPGDDVGATENDGKPFCTSTGLGGSVFPSGFIKSAHFAKTSTYSQVTGRIDRTKYQLKSTDGGGQYDNKDVSATCNGYKYFVNLVEPDANIFCIRCCKSQADCKLGLSTYGCQRVVPGDYS